MTWIPQKQISVETRFGSMIADHFIMTFVMMIFCIPLIISDTSDPGKDAYNDPFIRYLSFIGFALYFCKDCINGQSVAKRYFKLQVVNNKTGIAAAPWQCLVRNFFCVMWPIEVLVAFKNPNRRIGDRVAGTKLVFFDPEIKSSDINFFQLAICFVLSYGLLTLISLSI